MDLILASTSSYRKKLLQRLGIPFSCRAPECEETALPGETAAQLAGRLALLKATAVARQLPGVMVIGSDQVASIDGLPLIRLADLLREAGLDPLGSVCLSGKSGGQ